MEAGEKKEGRNEGRKKGREGKWEEGISWRHSGF